MPFHSFTPSARLSREFDGKLRIAYSGGADYYNIDRIVGCGVWPVTVATTLLKPGGYYSNQHRLNKRYGVFRQIPGKVWLQEK